MSQLNSPPVKSASRRRGCLLAGCLTLLGLSLIALIIGVIAAPAVFHLLPVQYQNGLARRVAFLNDWIPTETPAPTRSYTADNLPTADTVQVSAAMALLNTPIPPTMTPVSPTAVPSNRPTDTSIPSTSGAIVQAAANTVANVSSAAPTTQPTDLPTGTSANLPVIPTTAATAVLATAIPSASPTDIPIPAAFYLGGYKIVYQGWNNCGPANLTQVLNAYGVNSTQDQAAAWLKPSGASKNVSPWQMAAYVNTHTSMRAVLRFGGSLDLIKRLLNAHFRPLIETGFVIPNNPKEGWMGHYLTPAGYDDGQSIFYGYDTYLGDGSDHRGEREDYIDLDTRWEQFNRVYIVVYPASRESDLMTLLGPDADQTLNLQRTLAQAQHDAEANNQNSFAWFNIGSANTMLHNYQAAATAYDQSRNVGGGLPWRMLWYQFGPLEAYYAVGDYKTDLQLIAATLGTTVDIEEPFYWRGMVEAAQNNSKAAITDFHNALNFNPNYAYAIDALKAVQNNQPPTLPDVP